MFKRPFLLEVIPSGLRKVGKRMGVSGREISMRKWSVPKSGSVSNSQVGAE